jgi:hypothetical protein
MIFLMPRNVKLWFEAKAMPNVQRHPVEGGQNRCGPETAGEARAGSEDA